MSAASRTPITLVESAVSTTRRQTRRLVLARMFSFTAPDGRWVASSRWMPRLRPRWAMSTMPATKSGISLTRVANSSQTMTRLGGAPAGSTSSISRMSLARPSSRAMRRWSSARRLVRARIDIRPSRLVTEPTVWGRPRSSALPAPPL
jgi:hypothetical protein